MYLEAYSRFPYSAPLGDQALRRASVPSKADPSYVDWFRVCSHPYVVLGEGPSASFGPAESRLEYVSFLNLFVFYYVVVLFRCYLISYSYPFSFFFQFLNEWPSRVAPLARLPAVAEMTPRERHALDVYLDDVKYLFVE